MNSKAFHQPSVESDSVSNAPKPELLTSDFLIGEWLVKPQLNELQHLNGDASRHLEPRLAKLLCYLAAHDSEVVDRDTLVSLLWPKVIVNENSLTRAVSELRKQLSSPNGEKLTYIETIPKRGYRLRLPVQGVLKPSQNVVEDFSAKHSVSQHAISQTVPVFAAAKQSVGAALCLSLVLGAWLQSNVPDSANGIVTPEQWSDELVVSTESAGLKDEIVLSSTIPLDEDSGKTTKPVLSQDEEQFAFIQYDHTGSTLYLGQVNSDFEPVPVFNSLDVLYNLAWSPLGNALIFASKPALTPALYDEKRNLKSELFSFDLDSFRLSKLVEKSPFDPTHTDTSELSLT